MEGITGNNNSDLTEMNRSAIVKLLQQQDVCSRADIARQTGLTQAAITKIVTTLIDMDIVSEVGSIKGCGNRRSIGLKLNSDKYQVIGVKFARHMFAVGIFDISGKMYAQSETMYSFEQGQESVLFDMKKQIHEALDTYKNVVAIGLAVPGPYLREEGHIAVVTQMPTWHNINFIEEFKDEFDTPLFIEHDAKAGALASWWFGENAKSIHTLAYFLVGEGVGAGIIESGNLLLGAQGAASEIGHTSVDVNGPRCECGNYGCLEMYCSSAAMYKLAKIRAPECFLAPPEQSYDACKVVFAAARNGNKNALSVVQEIAKYIAYGCVTIINTYNPDVIVIGDSVSEGGNLLLPIIQSVVKQRVITQISSKVQIQISKLTVDPTLYGAAAIATDKVLQTPSAFLKAKNKEPLKEPLKETLLERECVKESSKECEIIIA